MPRQYTVRPGEKVELSAPVATIEPSGTPVLVTGLKEGSTFLAGGATLDAKGARGLGLVASSTARVVVTYEEEVEPDKKGKLIGEAG